MSLREVIYECPGFRVLKRENAAGSEFPAYAPGDEIALPFESERYGVLWHMYRFGDVMSFALQYGEDPFEAVERAKARGDNVYWLNQKSVVISNQRPERKPVYFGQKFGDHVRYAGKVFQLARAPNQNIKLVAIDPVAA